MLRRRHPPCNTNGGIWCNVAPNNRNCPLALLPAQHHDRRFPARRLPFFPCFFEDCEAIWKAATICDWPPSSLECERFIAALLPCFCEGAQLDYKAERPAARYLKKGKGSRGRWKAATFLPRSLEDCQAFWKATTICTLAIFERRLPRCAVVAFRSAKGRPLRGAKDNDRERPVVAHGSPTSDPPKSSCQRTYRRPGPTACHFGMRAGIHVYA
jgi:hypothetical protein